MSQDIKLSINECKFKYRVSGILKINYKVLTVQMNDNGFYCFPGGHVELMENTKKAIIREFKEETEIDVEIEKLLYITENFFDGNLGKFHEVGFYYLLRPKNELDTKDFTKIEEDKNQKMKLEFKWQDINNLQNFKPELVKKEIKNINVECKHFIVLNDKII